MDDIIENIKLDNLKVLIGKMIKIMEAVKSIRKNGTHPLGYKYCTDDDVLEGLRVALAKNRVFMFTSVEEVSLRADAGKGDKVNTIIRVRTRHTFYCADTGASLVCHSAGEGLDQDYKGLSKAFTGAVKKILMKNFLVPGEKGHQGGNGAQAELTIGTIMNLFTNLGMKKITPAHYRTYLKEKYKIDSPEKMAPEQLREQKDMLENLRSNTGGEGGYQISDFENHLLEKFSDNKGQARHG